jgi:5-dehydro-4-deoxyglucarate dehydratase
MELNQNTDVHSEAAGRCRLFYLGGPPSDIRDRVKGHSVSLVKGSLDAIGRSGGSVRPPLQNQAPQNPADLKAFIASVS